MRVFVQEIDGPRQGGHGAYYRAHLKDLETNKQLWRNVSMYQVEQGGMAQGVTGILITEDGQMGGKLKTFDVDPNADHVPPSASEAPQEEVVPRTPTSYNELVEELSETAHRFDGVAYGAGGHFSSRVLAAWLISHDGALPNDEEMAEISQRILSLSEMVYEGRPQ